MLQVCGLRVGVLMAFAVAGAVSRFALQLTHSRLQVAAFVVAAVALEWLGSRWMPIVPSRFWGVANALAASAAILIVRWHLEGLCPHRQMAHCLPGTLWRIVDAL